MVDSLSSGQARRIALAAQGFTDPPPGGPVTRRHLRRVLGRTAMLQVDSVNVLQRAHYVPVFSRLGPYPTELVDRAAGRAPRELFEYWGHAASLLPTGLHPYLRWRMAQAREEAWGSMRHVATQRPDLVEWVRQEVAGRGPLTSAELEAVAPGPGRRDPTEWGWNWSDVKRALEFLFWSGEVTSAGRTSAFARRYDVPERVLPPAVLATPTPSDADAYRELVRVAAASLGVATEVDLRDYFRLPATATRPAVQDLVDAGELVPVTVEGWGRPAWLHAGARVARRVRAAALVSPFDPLVWERSRTMRLFGVHYRIEIYVPAAKRVHGYYVLPFLLGDELVARVDLKADRAAGVLRVPGAWVEPGQRPEEVAGPLADALRSMAGWLGLSDVARPDRGDLAGPLAGTLGGPVRATVVR
jgi:uncharacterized protein YcaQ